MLEISSKTNLLEKKSYKYSLQDVAEPNLQRDIYSYGTIPKVAFNHRRVPMSMPEEIWITDTSLRDGQQSVEPYSVDQIVNIYKLLSKLGGPYGIIRQTEFFIYSKKDRQAIEKCMELDLKFPEITSWIRASKQDFQLVKDLGIKETGVLVSCSDYHIFKKMNMTRQQCLDHYLGVIKDAFDAGVIPRCHLEDITRADFYGFVVPFVNELQALSKEAGIPVKIRACDTMGYGVPYTEAAMPRSVAGIIYGLQHYADVPSECLEWHGHNDFYKAVANASTAWLYGACAVNCSLLGIGERTGNVPLEAMVFESASLRGSLDGMDTTVITEIADFFKKDIGYEIPPQDPLRRLRLQHHPGRYPRRRSDEGRGDLHHFRHQEDPGQACRRADQQDLRSGRYRLLDQRHLRPGGRRSRQQARRAGGPDEGADRRRVRGRSSDRHD